MSDALCRLSACDLVAGIRQKRFSCVDVMESVVGRIRALNPELNAIVYDYGDEALAAAKRAHRALTDGAALGPLHGIPVTIKENVDVKARRPPTAWPRSRASSRPITRRWCKTFWTPAR